MLDLTVIILTYNEQIHIQRCIEHILPITKQIYIVDSFSSDNTIGISKKLGVEVFQNKWPGDQAKQFNWALNNLPIQTKWILRLDADEYLTDELIEELKLELPKLPEATTGVIFKRRHIYLGKWMKRGVYPVKLLRLFQYKKAVCEQRLMDEHIQLLEGESIEFKHDFVDHNLNDLSWWSTKHVGYAIREAVELLDIEFNLLNKNESNPSIGIGKQAEEKRKKKASYASKPLFLRSLFYFIYRYIIKLGFTEGKEAFLWHFLQGWWYRTLVDAKIFEIKKACGNDREKIIDYIRENYNIDCRSM